MAVTAVSYAGHVDIKKRDLSIDYLRTTLTLMVLWLSRSVPRNRS
jgi:hypothetical protein